MTLHFSLFCFVILFLRVLPYIGCVISLLRYSFTLRFCYVLFSYSSHRPTKDGRRRQKKPKRNQKGGEGYQKGAKGSQKGARSRHEKGAKGSEGSERGLEEGKGSQREPKGAKREGKGNQKETHKVLFSIFFQHENSIFA